MYIYMRIAIRKTVHILCNICLWVWSWKIVGIIHPAMCGDCITQLTLNAKSLLWNISPYEQKYVKIGPKRAENNHQPTIQPTRLIKQTYIKLYTISFHRMRLIYHLATSGISTAIHVFTRTASACFDKVSELLDRWWGMFQSIHRNHIVSVAPKTWYEGTTADINKVFN
jgi:hypothetical protein